MKKLILFTTLTLLPLALAQTGGEETGGTGGAAQSEGDMQVTQPMSQPMTQGMQQEMPASTATVRGTLDLFSEGLGNLMLAQVVQNIEGWQERLRAADDPQLASIAEELEELKAELQSGSVNREAASVLLTSLGEQTVAAAEAASSGLQDRLTVLGAFLQEVGQVAQTQPAPQTTVAVPVVPPTVNATATLLQGNLAQLPPVIALVNIAGWQQRLQGLDNPDLEPVIETLGQLQSQLQETPDQGAVAETLGTLAEQTRSVAGTAGPGLSESLVRFAALLEGLSQ